MALPSLTLLLVLLFLFLPSIIGIIPSFGLSIHYTNLLINDKTIDANSRNEFKESIIMLYIGIFLAALSTFLILRINHWKLSPVVFIIFALAITSLVLIGVGASKIADKQTLENNEAYKGVIPSISTFAILLFILVVFQWFVGVADKSSINNDN